MTKPDSSALGAGISILAFGALLLLQNEDLIDLQPGWLLAALTACAGLALASRSLSAPEPSAGPREGRVEPALPREEARRASWAGFLVAVILGIGLFFFWATGILESAGSAALAALVVTIALALISAPLWWTMVRRLGAERMATARSQERAEVAAHLHDSVLQTLALVQQRADDPEEVAKLARRQERELRTWLAGEEPLRPGERLADALRAAAAEVEETHGGQIEAVVVGDAALDERREALVAATREALTNAAKFASGGGPVRLYAEIEDSGARVFVDDRGPGFDPDAIPDDRRGVRESIIGRMERYGGRAEIRSGPGGGTEIELAIEGNGR
jgi:signal transduction histidine kinase